MGGIIDCMEMSLSKLREIVMDKKPFMLQFIGLQGTVHDLKESESLSVMFNSLQPHDLYSPWNSLGQNIGVDFLFSRGLPHP